MLWNIASLNLQSWRRRYNGLPEQHDLQLHLRKCIRWGHVQHLLLVYCRSNSKGDGSESSVIAGTNALCIYKIHKYRLRPSSLAMLKLKHHVCCLMASHLKTACPKCPKGLLILLLRAMCDSVNVR